MATWNERIDNIQTRLANLVSEEFSRANVYNIEITPSSYNTDIDSNIILTVKVTNVGGEAIEDYEVQLYKNGTSMGSSYNSATNSNGIVTFSVPCNEWGLITFSVDNASTQINVTGFKQIQNYANGFYTLSVDGSTRTARLRVNMSNVNLSSGENYKQTGWINSSYRPAGTMYSPLNRLQTALIYANNGGDVAVYNGSGSTLSSFSATTILYWNY